VDVAWQATEPLAAEESSRRAGFWSSPCKTTFAWEHQGRSTCRDGAKPIPRNKGGIWRVWLWHLLAADISGGALAKV
jgi:hypothetical protein